MTIKIGFILLSDQADPMPSTRIAVTNMLPFLRGAGFDPQIVFAPPTPTETPDVDGLAPRIYEMGFDIVVFQKVHGRSVLRLVAGLAARGIKTYYLVCDLVNLQMVAATHATGAVTEFLRALYPRYLQYKIDVVHDGIERAEIFKSHWRRDRGSMQRPLKAVLVTSGQLDTLPQLKAIPPWLKVSVVGRYPAQPDWRRRVRRAWWSVQQTRSLLPTLRYLRFVATSRLETLAWDAATVYDMVRDADIGIIPIDDADQGDARIPMWKVKSENRLTMKMAVGLPVIATPIPSYRGIIKQGENGFFAETIADWTRCLNELRDVDARWTIGANARSSVLDRYGKHAQARRLIASLRRLVPAPERVLIETGANDRATSPAF